MTMGIYQIRNKIDNKIYIGSSIHIEQRWYKHRYYLNKNEHPNKHLQNSWNKYGEDNFSFEILELVENRSDLLNVEQLWFDNTKCYEVAVGYNIEKIASAHYEYIHSNETKKNLSQLFRGKNNRKEVVLTEEQVKEIYLLLHHGIEGKELAKIYKVSKKTIMKINSSDLWIDVTKDIDVNAPLKDNLQEIVNKTIDKPSNDRRRNLSIDTQCKALELLKNKEMTQKEIASHLGITIHQVKWMTRSDNKYRININSKYSNVKK